MYELARLAQHCAVASSLLLLAKGEDGGVSCSARDIQARQSAARSGHGKYSMRLWLVDCGVRWGFEMHEFRSLLGD